MTTKVSIGRRRFLTTLGAGGAAAAVVMTRQNAQDASGAAKTPDRQGKGYRLTEHVRDYYRTARV